MIEKNGQRRPRSLSHCSSRRRDGVTIHRLRHASRPPLMDSAARRLAARRRSLSGRSDEERGPATGYTRIGSLAQRFATKTPLLVAALSLVARRLSLRWGSRFFVASPSFVARNLSPRLLRGWTLVASRAAPCSLRNRGEQSGSLAAERHDARKSARRWKRRGGPWNPKGRSSPTLAGSIPHRKSPCERCRCADESAGCTRRLWRAAAFRTTTG
jgi:hypothetical protein